MTNDVTPEQLHEQFYVAGRELTTLLGMLRSLRSNPTAYKTLPPLGQAISDVQSMVADLFVLEERVIENFANEPVFLTRPVTDDEVDAVVEAIESGDQDYEPSDTYHDEDIMRGDR